MFRGGEIGGEGLSQLLAIILVTICSFNNGRSERIRTSGPLVPNEVRYQAALHSAAPPDLFSGRTLLRGSYNGAVARGQARCRETVRYTR